MQQTNNIHNIKLNWAGLGRTQPQRCWADFGPKMDWANLGPTETNIPFWARPGPEGRAGPGSAWPSNQNGWGENNSPRPFWLGPGGSWPSPVFWAGSGPEEYFFFWAEIGPIHFGLSPAQLFGPAQPDLILYIIYILYFVLFIYIYIYT